MDLTDAINMMVWAAVHRNRRPGCAIWHIFSAADTHLLCKFLKEVCSFKGPGDPVHSQWIYLTPRLLELLFKLYHIQPYTIYQYPGQAVYIPAYYTDMCAMPIRSESNLNKTPQN